MLTKTKSLNEIFRGMPNNIPRHCQIVEITSVVSKQEFIQTLIDKHLGFGWYNGEFVTNPTI